MDEQKGTLVEIDLTKEKLEDKVEIILNDNYEIKIEDGKTYIVRKQLPKTFRECCKVLNLNEDGKLYTKGYRASLIQATHQLLICRDAYWKLAEWNPKIKGEKFYMNSLPSFLRDLFPMPIEEMRDAFYDNFKDLIEQCKELL